MSERAGPGVLVFVVPDGGGEREDALQDAGADAGTGAAAVAFEIELSLERLVHRLDVPTVGRSGAPSGCSINASSMVT